MKNTYEEMYIVRQIIDGDIFRDILVLGSGNDIMACGDAYESVSVSSESRDNVSEYFKYFAVEHGTSVEVSLKWDGCAYVSIDSMHQCDAFLTEDIVSFINASRLVASVVLANERLYEYSNIKESWNSINCYEGVGEYQGQDVYKILENGDLKKIDIPFEPASDKGEEK